MKCLLLRCRHLERLWVLVAIISLLPSSSYAGMLKSVPYARLPDIPVDQTSIDLYPCSQTSRTLVVYVHGGGWVGGDKANVYSMPAYFESNNICFASINYPLQSSGAGTVMNRQLDALLELGIWISSGGVRSKAFESISILGHSSGAHLVALLDKRFGWSSEISNLILMDSASYDLEEKYRNSSFRFKRLLEGLLNLNRHHFDSSRVVLRRFSPALLTPSPRVGDGLNIFILSGRRAAAKLSAKALLESYANASGYNVKTYEYPWRHRDFPRKIGTDTHFNQQFLNFIKP